MQILRKWDDVVSHVKSFPPQYDIIFSKENFNPNILKEYKSVFSGSGDQSVNYSIKLKDGSSIHIKEYDEGYKIHWDSDDPTADPTNRAIDDTPQHASAIVGILGALTIGYATVKS